MKKTVLLGFAIALATMAGSACAESAAQGEIYTGLGSTGYGIGYAHNLTASSSVRAELNVFNYSNNFNSGDVGYNGSLKLNTVSAYYDFFPFEGSSFRLSGGAVVGDRKVELNAKSAATYTINGTTYSAVGQSLYGAVKLPPVSPYIGLGFGHKATKPGFTFIADLGLAYGSPDVTLSASSGLLAQAGQANIDAERRKVEDKVNKYDLYPVIKIGIGYAF